MLSARHICCPPLLEQRLEQRRGKQSRDPCFPSIFFCRREWERRAGTWLVTRWIASDAPSGHDAALTTILLSRLTILLNQGALAPINVLSAKHQPLAPAFAL